MASIWKHTQQHLLKTINCCCIKTQPHCFFQFKLGVLQHWSWCEMWIVIVCGDRMCFVHWHVSNHGHIASVHWESFESCEMAHLQKQQQWNVCNVTHVKTVQIDIVLWWLFANHGTHLQKHSSQIFLACAMDIHSACRNSKKHMCLCMCMALDAIGGWPCMWPNISKLSRQHVQLWSGMPACCAVHHHCESWIVQTHVSNFGMLQDLENHAVFTMATLCVMCVHVLWLHILSPVALWQWNMQKHKVTNQFTQHLCLLLPQQGILVPSHKVSKLRMGASNHGTLCLQCALCHHCKSPMTKLWLWKSQEMHSLAHWQQKLSPEPWNRRTNKWLQWPTRKSSLMLMNSKTTNNDNEHHVSSPEFLLMCLQTDSFPEIWNSMHDICVPCDFQHTLSSPCFFHVIFIVLLLGWCSVCDTVFGATATKNPKRFFTENLKILESRSRGSTDNICFPTFLSAFYFYFLTWKKNSAFQCSVHSGTKKGAEKNLKWAWKFMQKNLTWVTQIACDEWISRKSGEVTMKTFAFLNGFDFLKSASMQKKESWKPDSSVRWHMTVQKTTTTPAPRCVTTAALKFPKLLGFQWSCFGFLVMFSPVFVILLSGCCHCCLHFWLLVLLFKCVHVPHGNQQRGHLFLSEILLTLCWQSLCLLPMVLLCLTARQLGQNFREKLCLCERTLVLGIQHLSMFSFSKSADKPLFCWLRSGACVITAMQQTAMGVFCGVDRIDLCMASVHSSMPAHKISCWSEEHQKKVCVGIMWHLSGDRFQSIPLIEPECHRNTIAVSLHKLCWVAVCVCHNHFKEHVFTICSSPVMPTHSWRRLMCHFWLTGIVFTLISCHTEQTVMSCSWQCNRRWQFQTLWVDHPTHRHKMKSFHVQTWQDANEEIFFWQMMAPSLLLFFCKNNSHTSHSVRMILVPSLCTCKTDFNTGWKHSESIWCLHLFILQAKQMFIHVRLDSWLLHAWEEQNWTNSTKQFIWLLQPLKKRQVSADSGRQHHGALSFVASTHRSWNRIVIFLTSTLLEQKSMPNHGTMHQCHQCSHKSCNPNVSNCDTGMEMRSVQHWPHGNWTLCVHFESWNVPVALPCLVESFANGTQHCINKMAMEQWMQCQAHEKHGNSMLSCNNHSWKHGHMVHVITDWLQWTSSQKLSLCSEGRWPKMDLQRRRCLPLPSPVTSLHWTHCCRCPKWHTLVESNVHHCASKGPSQLPCELGSQQLWLWSKSGIVSTLNAHSLIVCGDRSESIKPGLSLPGSLAWPRGQLCAGPAFICLLVCHGSSEWSGWWSAQSVELSWQCQKFTHKSSEVHRHIQKLHKVNWSSHTKRWRAHFKTFRPHHIVQLCTHKQWTTRSMCPWALWSGVVAMAEQFFWQKMKDLSLTVVSTCWHKPVLCAACHTEDQRDKTQKWVIDLGWSGFFQVKHRTHACCFFWHRSTRTRSMANGIILLFWPLRTSWKIMWCFCLKCQKSKTLLLKNIWKIHSSSQMTNTHQMMTSFVIQRLSHPRTVLSTCFHSDRCWKTNKLPVHSQNHPQQVVNFQRQKCSWKHKRHINNGKNNITATTVRAMPVQQQLQGQHQWHCHWQKWMEHLSHQIVKINDDSIVGDWCSHLWKILFVCAVVCDDENCNISGIQSISWLSSAPETTTLQQQKEQQQSKWHHWQKHAAMAGRQRMQQHCCNNREWVATTNNGSNFLGTTPNRSRMTAKDSKTITVAVNLCCTIGDSTNRITNKWTVFSHKWDCKTWLFWCSVCSKQRSQKEMLISNLNPLCCGWWWLACLFDWSWSQSSVLLNCCFVHENSARRRDRPQPCRIFRPRFFVHQQGHVMGTIVCALKPNPMGPVFHGQDQNCLCCMKFSQYIRVAQNAACTAGLVSSAEPTDLPPHLCSRVASYADGNLASGTEILHAVFSRLISGTCCPYELCMYRIQSSVPWLKKILIGFHASSWRLDQNFSCMCVIIDKNCACSIVTHMFCRAKNWQPRICPSCAMGTGLTYQSDTSCWLAESTYLLKRWRILLKKLFLIG